MVPDLMMVPMELSQRLDLAKLGLEASDEATDTADRAAEIPADGDALTQLAALLVQVGAVDRAEEVTASSTLDSLGVDSLTRIELAVRAEDHFGVRVDDTTFTSWSTLGDAADFFAEHQ